jgi:putrescine transport system substrate-binding protein
VKFNIKISTAVATVITIVFANLAYATEEKVLNVYNWTEYIAPDTIANFEKETGIKVHYDTYEDNEALDKLLFTKKSGYDIVVPSSDWAKVQIENGLFLKLDKSKLPNLANLDSLIQNRLKESDPNNNYLVSYLWGYTTVGVNVAAVVKALGKTPIPDNTWELVFNPTYTSKLKSCGIAYLDSASDIIPLALHYIDKPAYSNKAADYLAVAEMLKKVRPDIKRFASDAQAEQFIDDSVCVAIGYAGDFYRARNLSTKKNSGQNIAPIIPKTGALMFMDSIAIPKDAKHPNNAHLFINFILDAKVHADISNATKYANANKASLKFIEKEIVNDRSLFLPESDFGRLVAPISVNSNIKRIRSETFDKFKAEK